MQGESGGGGGVYGYARSEPPIYGSAAAAAAKKVPPKVPPKPSVSGVLFPGNGLNGGATDVIDIMKLPKSDTKDSVRNITHV